MSARDVVRRVAGVLLVDPAGRVLMQLRDSKAPTSPDKWSIVGGHLEPGEDPRAAAHRELLEEAALTVDGPLAPVFTGLLPAGSGHGHTQWWVYAGTTTAGDTDIVVGEGAAIVFVPPAELLGLDLAPSAAQVLPDFLSSTVYGLVRERAHTLARVNALTGGLDDALAAARRRLGEIDRALGAAESGAS